MWSSSLPSPSSAMVHHQAAAAVGSGGPAASVSNQEEELPPLSVPYDGVEVFQVLRSLGQLSDHAAASSSSSSLITGTACSLAIAGSADEADPLEYHQCPLRVGLAEGEGNPMCIRVQAYERAAAGKQLSVEHLRTPPALEKSMHFLVHYFLRCRWEGEGNTSSSSKSISSPLSSASPQQQQWRHAERVWMYLWDRWRGVRCSWVPQLPPPSAVLTNHGVPSSLVQNQQRIRWLSFMVAALYTGAASLCLSHESCQRFVLQKKNFLESVSQCFTDLIVHYRSSPPRYRHAEMFSVLLLLTGLSQEGKVEDRPGFCRVESVSMQLSSSSLSSVQLPESPSSAVSIVQVYRELQYQPHLVNTKPVQAALRLLQCLADRNYFEFLSLAAKGTGVLRREVSSVGSEEDAGASDGGGEEEDMDGENSDDDDDDDNVETASKKKARGTAPFLTPLQRAVVFQSFAYVRYRAMLDLLIPNFRVYDRLRVRDAIAIDVLADALLMPSEEACILFLENFGVGALLFREDGSSSTTTTGVGKMKLRLTTPGSSMPVVLYDALLEACRSRSVLLFPTHRKYFGFSDGDCSSTGKGKKAPSSSLQQSLPYPRRDVMALLEPYCPPYTARLQSCVLTDVSEEWFSVIPAARRRVLSGRAEKKRGSSVCVGRMATTITSSTGWVKDDENESDSTQGDDDDELLEDDEAFGDSDDDVEALDRMEEEDDEEEEDDDEGSVSDDDGELEEGDDDGELEEGEVEDDVSLVTSSSIFDSDDLQQDDDDTPSFLDPEEQQDGHEDPHASESLISTANRFTYSSDDQHNVEESVAARLASEELLASLLQSSPLYQPSQPTPPSPPAVGVPLQPVPQVAAAAAAAATTTTATPPCADGSARLQEDEAAPVVSETAVLPPVVSVVTPAPPRSEPTSKVATALPAPPETLSFINAATATGDVPAPVSLSSLAPTAAPAAAVPTTHLDTSITAPLETTSTTAVPSSAASATPVVTSKPSTATPLPSSAATAPVTPPAVPSTPSVAHFTAPAPSLQTKELSTRSSSSDVDEEEVDNLKQPSTSLSHPSSSSSSTHSSTSDHRSSASVTPTPAAFVSKAPRSGARRAFIHPFCWSAALPSPAMYHGVWEQRSDDDDGNEDDDDDDDGRTDEGERKAGRRKRRRMEWREDNQAAAAERQREDQYAAVLRRLLTRSAVSRVQLTLRHRPIQWLDLAMEVSYCASSSALPSSNACLGSMMMMHEMRSLLTCDGSSSRPYSHGLCGLGVTIGPTAATSQGPEVSTQLAVLHWGLAVPADDDEEGAADDDDEGVMAPPVFLFRSALQGIHSTLNSDADDEEGLTGSSSSSSSDEGVESIKEKRRVVVVLPYSKDGYAASCIDSPVPVHIRGGWTAVIREGLEPPQRVMKASCRSGATGGDMNVLSASLKRLIQRAAQTVVTTVAAVYHHHHNSKGKKVLGGEGEASSSSPSSSSVSDEDRKCLSAPLAGLVLLTPPSVSPAAMVKAVHQCWAQYFHEAVMSASPPTQSTSSPSRSLPPRRTTKFAAAAAPKRQHQHEVSITTRKRGRQAESIGFYVHHPVFPRRRAASTTTTMTTTTAAPSTLLSSLPVAWRLLSHRVKPLVHIQVVEEAMSDRSVDALSRAYFMGLQSMVQLYEKSL